MAAREESRAAHHLPVPAAASGGLRAAWTVGMAMGQQGKLRPRQPAGPLHPQHRPSTASSVPSPRRTPAASRGPCPVPGDQRLPCHPVASCVQAAGAAGDDQEAPDCPLCPKRRRRPMDWTAPTGSAPRTCAQAPFGAAAVPPTALRCPPLRPWALMLPCPLPLPSPQPSRPRTTHLPWGARPDSAAQGPSLPWVCALRPGHP